ncbi:MAG: SRPBCC domain-containing protein [Candidatus Pacearchaeota archaeon]
MKTIKQTIQFNCSANDFYEYFINPKKLSKIIGGKVVNSMKVPGKFSSYDNYIKGENIELLPGSKIVQNWTCVDFPDKHFSKVTINIKKKTDKSCEIELIQENVPDDLYEDISLLWNEFYWDPIKDYLEDLIWK